MRLGGSGCEKAPDFRVLEAVIFHIWRLRFVRSSVEATQGGGDKLSCRSGNGSVFSHLGSVGNTRLLWFSQGGVS